MNFFSYTKVETGRLFRSKSAWLVMVLTLLCPLAGYSLHLTAVTATISSLVLANPVLTGGIGGGILFALLSLFESDRVYKSHTDALTESITSPLMLSGAKLIALLASALASTVAAALLYLPYTAYRMGNVFDFTEYLTCFFLLMLPSLWLSVLAATALYQIIRRIDLSFVLFAAFTFFSLSKWAEPEYILRWINPLVPGFSDNFSNGIIFRTAAYNRLFWLSLLTGLWFLSLMCVRNHRKGLLGSFAHNVRFFYLPILSIAFLGLGISLYRAEPYIDHSPVKREANLGKQDTTASESPYAKENPNVRLLSTQLDTRIDAAHSRLKSTAVYQLINDSGKSQNCVLQINPGYTISRITANGHAISFTDKKNDHDQMKDISLSLPAEKQIKLKVEYKGYPKIWHETRKQLSGPKIESNYIELNGIHLRPVLNADAKGAGITGNISLPAGLELISSGKPAELLHQNSDGTKTWHIDDPNGLVSRFAGDYVKKDLSDGGIPTYFYYNRKHEKQMDKQNIKQILENTIAYCTKQFGPLPYTPDNPLSIIETAGHMFGGGSSDNLNITDESSFSKEGAANTHNGASVADSLSTEIIQTWWMQGPMVMDPANPDWTIGGLSVYAAYRMAKETQGDAYAMKHHVEEWKKAWKSLNRSFYVRHPEYAKILPEKYIADLQVELSTIRTHAGMALKIYKAAQLIGEDKMDEVLTSLYQNGGTEHPPFITWHDFLNACNLKEEDLNIDDTI
ncbi:M1 aminopeptidase family protein [Lactovum odontotermitis]